MAMQATTIYLAPTHSYNRYTYTWPGDVWWPLRTPGVVPICLIDGVVHTILLDFLIREVHNASRGMYFRRSLAVARTAPLFFLVLPLSVSATLHDAAEAGDANAVAAAIADGADLSLKDTDHYSALHLACGMGHMHVAALLIKHGAPLAAVDENGETPLHLAAHIGHTRTVELLLEAGAPVDKPSDAGYTALHMAAQGGRVDAARALLSIGANVAAVTSEGATPLHWAAHHDHANVAALLMSHGAPLDARDASGATPVSVAKEAADDGRADVYELLKGLARHDREHRTQADREL